MGLETETPFTPQKLEEERNKDEKILTIRLNKDELRQLQEDMRILEQPKEGTAIKLLMGLGSNLIHDGLMGNVLAVVFKNKRKNRRLGIVEYET